jgi:hypothetical protein
VASVIEGENVSAPQFHAAEAVAFQLAAALELYEEGVGQLMAAASFDCALYSRVSRAVDEMRLYCASLPSLSVPWVHLLITHAELMHCFFEGARDGQVSTETGSCRERHLHALGALRQKCLYQFSRAVRH